MGNPPFGCLPGQRQRVLDFIKAELAAGRSWPSIDTITSHMGWKERTSAINCLQKLCLTDGMLRRTWISDGTLQSARFATSSGHWEYRLVAR